MELIAVAFSAPVLSVSALQHLVSYITSDVVTGNELIFNIYSMGGQKDP